VSLDHSDLLEPARGLDPAPACKYADSKELISLRLSPRRSRRFTAAGAALAVLVAVPTAVVAQTSSPEPVVDSAPRRILYGGDAVIRGHLEEGVAGQEVSLQERRLDADWRTVSTKEIDDDAEVRFRRHDITRSTYFRLVYVDPATDAESASERVRVAVRPELTLKLARKHTFVGRRTRVSGTLWPKTSQRRSVLLEQKVRGEWRVIDRVRVVDGRFSDSFVARSVGRRKVRATFGGDAISTKRRDLKGITVYRSDMATWYGPGLYGNGTACGQTMTSELLGVAHRTLPCGTMVGILYNGRSITVPVVDRGPYSHANWDLTQETAERLGFSGTGYVGVTR